MGADADRHLLFGLLALQNGLIDQTQLVAAFHAWTRDRAKPLADHLGGLGHLDADGRDAVEAMVALYLKKHGDDAERSLAFVPAGRSTRERLAGLGDPQIEASVARLDPGPSAAEETDPDRTTTYAVGTATADGRRFRVLRPHARGGLGAVFVALDEELHREVALKQILDHHADDPASRQRFLMEAEITGGLEHPGIVPVYGLGAYGDGRPYYAMRFVRGDSLKEAIASFHADAGLKADPGRRSLGLRKLLRRFTDVCNAIDYAHGRGVLHRDIKPGNVIVGKHGETLVVDWGLAKARGKTAATELTEERPLMPSSASGSAETLPGSALGTLAYMSPEQARGDLEALGPVSDVYSLGATLYCLLTGKAPFEGDDAGAALRAVQRGEFRSPRTLDPAIDAALEAVCLKAMATDPKGRYPSARALAEDVERWMADEPVAAWREPWTRTLARWLTRHRTGVTAAAATGLALLVGLAAVAGVQAQGRAALAAKNRDLEAANGRERRANAALQAANAKVEQRYGLAVEAIKTFHTDVSEDFLLKEDQFKDLRDRLLRDAIDFYGKLGALLEGESDLRSRRALGRAYGEVGDLIHKIGTMPEALAAHRKALELQRALAREATSDTATKADVGRSLLAIGILLDTTGRYDEALASYEEVRSVLGELAGSGPGRDAILGDIARSYFWSGFAFLRTGRRREARAAYEEARAIGAELTASHPDSVDYQRLLSWCDNDIGLLLKDEGKTSEALTACGRSRRIKQKIAADHPGVAEYQRDLAICHGNIGIVQREAGDLRGGLTSLTESLAIQQALADAYPAVTQAQNDLANNLNEIGDVLRVLDRTAEAQSSYERAVAICDGLVKANPTATKQQAWLIQGLKGLGATRLAGGQTADAAAAWRRAIAIGEGLRSDYGETLYYMAGCHALLGGVAGAPGSGLSAEDGRAELDRAMETLRQAVATGYHPVAWMRRDPDLDPLRPRPDFQLMMMDLAFPAEPFETTP